MIPGEEFERRVDVVHRTADPQTLDRLVGDLPALRPTAPARPEPEADRLIRTGARAVADAVRASQTLIAIMGGVDHPAESAPPDPNAPVLKINGFMLMGGVEINVRNPGESARDAKKRRREEKRLRRGR